MRSYLLGWGILCHVVGVPVSRADDVAATVMDHFHAGRFEGVIGQAVLFSPMIGAHRPPVNYTVTEIELGYMVTGVHGNGFSRGNLELVGTLFAGGIFDGRGNYVTGTTLWLRYNFLQPDDRFVPYVEGGWGLTETDVDRRIQGQNFNFNLNLAAGTRYFVAKDWSVNLACHYQHISDAHLARPNAGIDAIGPMLSVSHYF